MVGAQMAAASAVLFGVGPAHRPIRDRPVGDAPEGDATTCPFASVTVVVNVATPPVESVKAVGETEIEPEPVAVTVTVAVADLPSTSAWMVDVPAGEPSKWLTLFGTRVLDWWDSATAPSAAAPASTA